MANLILNGSTSGSVTLAAPAVSGTTTLTLPTTSGTIITTGNIPTGSILQVVSYTLTTAGTVASGSWQDIGLSTSITPSSTSNKILILVNAYMGATNSAMARLQRGGVDIINSTTAGTNQVTGGGIYNSTGNIFSSSISYLDSPSSTSSLTYRVVYYTDTGTIAYNRRTADTFSTGTSTITLMEIKG